MVSPPDFLLVFHFLQNLAWSKVALSTKLVNTVFMTMSAQCLSLTASKTSSYKSSSLSTRTTAKPFPYFFLDRKFSMLSTPEDMSQKPISNSPHAIIRPRAFTHLSSSNTSMNFLAKLHLQYLPGGPSVSNV
ncbi:MAG: hypothetical protein GSR79_04795 [Desulfurococcales archaeon]|nr:hypothetical protein [Desulfurococcales archaeon]